MKITIVLFTFIAILDTIQALTCDHDIDCNNYPNKVCSNKLCVCKKNYFEENDVCKALINGPCTKNADCGVNYSRCSRKVCKCAYNYYPSYDNKICKRFGKHLNDTCVETYGCRNMKFSVCSEDKKCVCKENYFEKNGVCKALIGDTCTKNIDCGVNNSTCMKKKCKCAYNYYPSHDYKICKKTAEHLNDRCVDTYGCRKLKNSVCSEDKKCVCETHYIERDGKCKPTENTISEQDDSYNYQADDYVSSINCSEIECNDSIKGSTSPTFETTATVTEISSRNFGTDRDNDSVSESTISSSFETTEKVTAVTSEDYGTDRGIEVVSDNSSSSIFETTEAVTHKFTYTLILYMETSKFLEVTSEGNVTDSDFDSISGSTIPSSFETTEAVTDMSSENYEIDSNINPICTSENCTSFIGSDCVNDTECKIENSLCDQGVCQCKDDHDYSPSLGICELLI